MPKNPSPRQKEASRSNGSKGCGPKTLATKQISAQNARKAGLFARTDALPHEIAEWGQRSQIWLGYYQPQAPATIHLTNECARATLLADRSDHFRQATIENQTQTERKKWLQQQKRKVTDLVSGLDLRVESTLASLLSFGAGVRWVIRGFSNLIDVVRSHGYLTPENLEFGIKLYGVTPTRENMTQRLMPYVINIYNLGSTPGVSPAVIADWLELENRPDELQDWSDDDLVDSDPEINREMLIGEFEREVERLQAIEKQVMEEVDQPSLQNVLDRASILTEADARRVARSHSESRTTYHKAAKDLWPMLEREQEDGLQEAAGDDAQGDGDATVAGRWGGAGRSG